jgi:hypothetical protein
MKLRSKLALALAFAVTSVSAHAASSVISWAYANGQPVNGSAGVISAPNWNLTGDAGSANLNYSDATASGATLSLAGGFGAWGIGGVSSPDGDGSTNKAIFDGYYNSFASTMTVGNIPFAEYNVYVYFSSDADNRTGTVSDGTTTYSFKTMAVAATAGSNAIFTQTTDTGAGNPSADYAVFSSLSGASKTFTISSNPTDGMGLAGIQIVQVPEPSAAILGGLGVLGLLRRRRVG